MKHALAAVAQDKTVLANESADLLYHLMVLWAACELSPEDVYARSHRAKRNPVSTRKLRASVKQSAAQTGALCF